MNVNKSHYKPLYIFVKFLLKPSKNINWVEKYKNNLADESSRNNPFCLILIWYSVRYHQRYIKNRSIIQYLLVGRKGRRDNFTRNEKSIFALSIRITSLFYLVQNVSMDLLAIIHKHTPMGPRHVEDGLFQNLGDVLTRVIRVCHKWCRGQKP